MSAHLFKTIEAQRMELMLKDRAINMLAAQNAQLEAGLKAQLGSWQRSLAAILHNAGGEIRVPKAKLDFPGGWEIGVLPEEASGDLLFRLTWPKEEPSSPPPPEAKNGAPVGLLVVPGKG